MIKDVPYTIAEGDSDNAKMEQEYREKFPSSRRMTIKEFCKKYGIIESLPDKEGEKR